MIARPPTSSRTFRGVRSRAPFPGGSATPSRSASTGATRVARSAGDSAATTVTTVPTISDTTIVRVSITVPLDGRSIPNETNSALMPFA